LRVVDERADILILIIGGRYGSINDQGKSVTNLEYIQARAKGIPVYVFVMRSILDVLPVWKANPQVDFGNVVDSPSLFEFVQSIRASQEVWVFPFDVAQDIAQTLRKQLAFLFSEALQLRIRAKAVGLPASLSQLKGDALRLVIERPPAWEFRLFGQVLSDKLAMLKPLRRDFNYRIVFGKGDLFDFIELNHLMRRKVKDLENNIASMNRLFNTALQDALGPPGIAGDPEGIAYAADKLAEAYQKALEWSLEWQYVHVEEELQNLVDIAARFPINLLDEIEDYSQRIQREVEQALSTPKKPGEERKVNLTLTLTMPDPSDFEEELQRVSELYGLALD
jgi:hypothetical protein